MKFNRLIGLGLITLMLGACGGSDQGQATEEAPAAASDEISVTEAELAGNPFMGEWIRHTACRLSRPLKPVITCPP